MSVPSSELRGRGELVRTTGEKALHSVYCMLVLNHTGILFFCPAVHATAQGQKDLNVSNLDLREQEYLYAAAFIMLIINEVPFFRGR